MDTEEGIKNKVHRDFSSQPLPGLQLPLITLFKEKKASQKASAELNVKRIFSIITTKHMTWEWDQMQKEKEKLKNLFLDSNKAIKENRASISRFYEIIREQREQKIKLEREMVYTKMDINEYEKVKETMEKYVKQYSMFENFLEGVAAESRTGDLLSVRDILMRYETLEGTRADLARILEAEMEAEAQIRQQMVELLENKSATLKALGNHLVILQVSCRQASDRRIYWELMVQRIKNMIHAQQEEAVVLRGACWDLYTQICRRKNAPATLAFSDLEAQLAYIQKAVSFFKEVLTIATGSMTGGGKNLRDTDISTKKKTIMEL